MGGRSFGRRALLPGALLLGSLLAAPTAPALQDPPLPPPPAAPAAQAPPAKPVAPGLPWKEGTHGKGRLEVLPSGLAVLHLEGTPEEMGEQHGALLRDAVRELVQNYLPRVLRRTREKALEMARSLEKQIPERHLREMRALAKAADVPYDDILLGSVVVELFGLHGCSGAVASGPATADGRSVVGRNLEWPDMGILGQYGLVIAAKPEGMHPFLSVGFPAVVGVVTGMNGDGVFSAELVVMNVPPTDGAEALKGVPYPVLQRRILEECGSLDAAARLVRSSPLTVPQNLLLADPDGGLVLECGPSRCLDRPPVDGLVVVTNYYDEREKAQEFDPRYKGLCASFASLSTGKVGVDSMERAIREASSSPVAASMSLQCCVFLPSTLGARVAVGRPPAVKRPMTDLDLAALLGVVAPADRRPDPAEKPGGNAK